MTFPQPTSSQSVLDCQECFRLFTEIESNGDIYEIDTSLKAFAIGPNSDVQNVRAWYPTRENAYQIESALISVNDPYVTRMDAYMAMEYPQLGAKQRILVAADDIVPHDGQYFNVASGEPDAADLIVWYRPYMDLLCYHRDPPTLPQTRAERQWQNSLSIYDRGQQEGGRSWYFFPHYRRKYFHVRFFNINAGATYTYSVYGVTFHAMQRQAGQLEYPMAAMTLLTTGLITAPAVNPVTNVVLYSDRVPDISTPVAHPIGYFDYICVSVEGDEIDGGLFTYVAFEVISTDWA